MSAMPDFPDTQDPLDHAEFFAEAIRRDVPRYDASNFREYLKAELAIAEARITVIKSNRRIAELGYKTKP